MRKALFFTSLLAVFAAVSLSPAAAQTNAKVEAGEKGIKPKLLKQTGTVISVDTAAQTFICKWQTNDWVYKVNEKTVFRSKGKTSNFVDLKLDSRVSMTFHMDGKQRVADIVTIEK